MKGNIHKHVNNLIAYAKSNLRLDEADEQFAKNAVMNLLDLHVDTAGEDESPDESVKSLEIPDTLLEPLSSYAIQNGLTSIEDKGLFETAVMGAVTPLPSQVNAFFKEDYERKGANGALLGLYNLGIKSNYIKLSDIQKNLYWKYSGAKSELEITVNLSKPEKDNKEIARLKSAPQTGYPKCMLCKENLGYKGRLGYPARQTLRFVPIELNGERWYLQYSPYMYYSEHCIIFKDDHTPMTTNLNTFVRLTDFVKLFPSYIAGSNACLPIVGGSILSHEHYQGGGHLMPIHFTKERWHFKHAKFPSVKFSVQEWYNSDIRVQSESKDELVAAADYIHELWRGYSDESVDIISRTDAEHNAITPICRMVGGEYSFDLILRNNRVNETYPDGIFHAHPEYHNIKKEGIGLIEAMGLFVLPGRLDKECKMIAELIESGGYDIDQDSPIYKHKGLIAELKKDESSAPIMDKIRKRIGAICEDILCNTAVFKDNQEGKDAFIRFMQKAGFERI